MIGIISSSTNLAYSAFSLVLTTPKTVYPNCLKATATARPIYPLAPVTFIKKINYYF